VVGTAKVTLRGRRAPEIVQLGAAEQASPPRETRARYTNAKDFHSSPRRRLLDEAKARRQGLAVKCRAFDLVDRSDFPRRTHPALVRTERDQASFHLNAQAIRDVARAVPCLARQQHRGPC